MLIGEINVIYLVVLGNRFKISIDYRFVIGRANQLAIDSTIGLDCHSI